MTEYEKNNKFKIARLTKGLSQQELADKVGVTSRTIQFYEKGIRFPPVNIAKKIVDELGKSIEEIFLPINTN